MFQPYLTWLENHFPICIKGKNLCKVAIMLFKPQNSSEDPVIHWGCLCLQELQVQQGPCWCFILSCCKAQIREIHLFIMPKWLKYLQLLSVYHLGLLLTCYLVSPWFLAFFFFIKVGFSSALGNPAAPTLQSLPPAPPAEDGKDGDGDGDDEPQPLHTQTAACSLPSAADGGEYFHSHSGRRVPSCRNGSVASRLHQAYQIRHRAWKVFNSLTSIKISRCQGNSFLQALTYRGPMQVAQACPVSPILTPMLQD